LDDQVALGFCRRKQIDVLFCRSDLGVARWQSGNLSADSLAAPEGWESWRGSLFAWRWSGDDVDVGQLVYPLIAFSHIRCSGHSNPSTSWSGMMVDD
jgi:hypothetical protein